jgi:hypothetical protein
VGSSRGESNDTMTTTQVLRDENVKLRELLQSAAFIIDGIVNVDAAWRSLAAMWQREVSELSPPIDLEPDDFDDA